MLECLGYGAAARVSGKCNDGEGAKTVEAFALDAESLHGPGQLSKTAGKVPAVGRIAARTANDAGTCDVVEGPVALAEIAAALTKPVLHRILAY